MRPAFLRLSYWACPEGPGGHDKCPVLERHPGDPSLERYVTTCLRCGQHWGRWLVPSRYNGGQAGFSWIMVTLIIAGTGVTVLLLTALAT